jgi:hypothetical protein
LAIARISVDDWHELLELTVSVVSDELASSTVKKYLNDRLVRRDLAEWVPSSDTWFDKNFKLWDENAKHFFSTDPLQSSDLIECTKVILELEKADPSSALCIALENYSRQKALTNSAMSLVSSITGAVGLAAHSLMIVCRHHLRKKTNLASVEIDSLIELLILSMGFHADNPAKPEYMPYLQLVKWICNQKSLTISVQKLQALLTSIAQLPIDSASVAKERVQMRDLIETLISGQSK